MGSERNLTASPFAFALGYGVFGAIYITFSDTLLVKLAGDYAHYQELQTYKGWGFIVVTSVGLWVTLRWAWSRLSQTVSAAIKAEDRLRLAMTAAGGLIWQVRFSPPKRIIHWQVDGGLARELGLPEGAWIGLDEMLCHIHPTDRGQFTHRVEQAFSGEVDASSPIWRFLSPDGSTRWVKLVLDSESCSGTTEIAMGGVAFDLTLQQEVAQDLAEVIYGAELGTWRLDVGTGRNKINDRYADLLGYSRDELEPMTADSFYALVHPDDRQQLLANQAEQSTKRDYLFTDEIRMRHKDGHWVWILTRCRPVEVSTNGVPLVLSGVHIDISRRKALEEKLQIESDFLRRLTETSISGIVAVNEAGRIYFANKEAADIMGLAQDELIDLPLKNDHWEETELDGTPLAPDGFPSAHVLRTQTSVRDRRVAIRLRDGSSKAISINAAPMMLPGGQVHVVSCVTDITAQLASEALLREAAAEAKYAALHDPMTGLPNRDLFQDYLNAAMATARQAGTCLLHVFLDLDNFKQVNDRFGHHVGDLLIRKVSERLADIRQGQQVLARVAGDEFTFLHPFSPGDDTNAVLRSLSLAFDLPFDLEGRMVYVTVSMGVSVYPQDATVTQDLWLDADLAMYEAKARGRNQTVRYSTVLRDRQIEEARIAQILQRAVKAGAFSIVLQPLVRLQGQGQIEGAEALLRCTDPDLHGIGPSEFLPVAERTGLMRGLDLMVVDLVGDAIKKLRLDGHHLRISINLSPDSLQQSSFGQDLLAHLEQAGLGASDVRFELTEGALVDLSNHARETLELLHKLGFELSADDFGTGYSSLSYLHRLRLKEIKIDRSFIQHLSAPEESSDEIVRAILAMGSALGVRVVAEGVETSAQRDWLFRNGCTLGQGFFFGKGVDLDTFRNRHLEPARVTTVAHI